MIRDAKRTLTGSLYGREPDIRMGDHAAGRPAVTVDLGGYRGTRTYDDPRALFAVAQELAKAAIWLARRQATDQP